MYYTIDDIYTAPIFTIKRYCTIENNTAINTMVYFMGCPLNCKHCFNPKCHEPIYEEGTNNVREGIQILTAQELYDIVKIDNLYFQATGGGICFTGGEPALYTLFIKEFRKICGNKWKITVQTSACCSCGDIKCLSDVADLLIVDIKSTSSGIYEEYTGTMSAVMQHFACLKRHVSPEKIIIKIPYIPSFNEYCNLETEVRVIKEETGFTNVIKFDYRYAKHYTPIPIGKGSQLCTTFKEIKKSIVENYGLNTKLLKCSFEKECNDKCTKCDKELQYFQEQIHKHGLVDINLTDIQLDIKITNTSKTLENTKTKEIKINTTDRKRVLYKECKIAGISFHDLSDIWEELSNGVKLALIRHRNNKYDKNAIAVALASDYDGNPKRFNFNNILGYVPKTENSHLADMFDMGWEEIFECEISQVNGYSSHRGSLYMNIYIIEKEKVNQLDTSNLLRVLELTDDNYKKVTTDLASIGSVYFQWGGDSSSLFDLPKRGENVVFIYRREFDTVLYLMHCISDDDNESPDLIGDLRIPLKNYCYYVFTNVRGPIIVKSDKIDFLKQETINYYQPEDFLSEDASLLLKKLINIEQPI